MHRRAWILGTLATAASGAAHAALAPAPAVQLPADFGAHPSSHTEWWYVTGGLEQAGARWGFQVTFFRARTDIAAAAGSRFAPTQLLFAHAALSDVAQGRLRHDQRIARSGFGVASAAAGETDVVLRDWRLARHDGSYRTTVASESAGFALDLALAPTQPVLLQGDAGLSRKGPSPESTSHYYSEPQLAVRGTLTRDGRAEAVTGRAWLDHEWSDSILPREAVGWDWIGMNLDDGAALTAFRLRRPDGSALYAGGSHRSAGGVTRIFGPEEVSFAPGRSWLSPASQARYPVAWTIATPVGTFAVAALFDAQELDSRQSTGSFYWEGLSSLSDAQGRRIGSGYLEMTGYADRLKL